VAFASAHAPPARTAILPRRTRAPKCGTCGSGGRRPSATRSRRRGLRRHFRRESPQIATRRQAL